MSLTDYYYYYYTYISYAAKIAEYAILHCIAEVGDSKITSSFQFR